MEHDSAVDGMPSIVTNSPSSFSTATEGLMVTSATELPDHMISNLVCSTEITTGSNNIDTLASIVTESRRTSSSSSLTATVCPIRASGTVCICDPCEASRLQLLQQQCKERNGSSTTNAVSRNIDPATTSHSVGLVRSKRPREEYRYNNDDDDENDDHCETATPADVGRRNDTPSSIAMTGVVTTANTSVAVKNSNNLNSEEETLQIMSSACRTILQCIGEDPDREGLQKTPERWAKALLYLCHGYHLSPHQVTNNAVFCENHNEMVVVRNIDIHSLCEHHMVPFTGHVHIGYIPNGKIIGLSKLARLADLFARRLQVQERLTRQIAEAIVETIEPLGVAVVMECTHYCMVMRGVQKTGAITTTSSVRGCFETNSKTRAEFFSILHGGK